MTGLLVAMFNLYAVLIEDWWYELDTRYPLAR